MKIVINRCHGGYGLSVDAYKLIADYRGEACFFFTTKYISGDYETATWVEMSIDEARKYHGVIYVLNIQNPDILDYGENWHDLSDEEKEEHNRLYDACQIPDFSGDRSNHLLVQVVEELGERANGWAADLKVVEIPDDVEWQIEEYDGMEWIAEKHRTWG